jgi:hypothetical protein
MAQGEHCRDDRASTRPKYQIELLVQARAYQSFDLPKNSERVSSALSGSETTLVAMTLHFGALKDGLLGEILTRSDTRQVHSHATSDAAWTLDRESGWPINDKGNLATPRRATIAKRKPSIVFSSVRNRT